MERADVMCPQHPAGIQAVKMTRIYRPIHTLPRFIEKILAAPYLGSVQKPPLLDSFSTRIDTNSAFLFVAALK